jgi:hypothetical protein
MRRELTGANSISSSPTLAAEETLEVRATGTFRYIAWCEGGMLLSLGQGQQQEGAVCDGRWMVLGGLYKVWVNGDEGATLVLSLQTASEAVTRPAALLAPVKVIPRSRCWMLICVFFWCESTDTDATRL